MSVVRPCTVLAAGLFVAAFALAMTIPPAAPLAVALALFDPSLPGRIHAATAAYLPIWVWEYVALPLILRPAWFVPAALGIICGGLALTFRANSQTHRSRHHPR